MYMYIYMHTTIHTQLLTLVYWDIVHICVYMHDYVHAGLCQHEPTW